MLPQFLYYNEVIITLFNDYTVSSINTKGYPNPDKDFTKSGPHLVSLSITAPTVGNGSNSDNVGATGKIVLNDYKNILFNKFTKYAKDLQDTKETALLPPVSISVGCYTGKYTYAGLIDEWTLQFNGGVPIYNLSWKSFSPTETKVPNGGVFGKYASPKEFISMVEKELSFGQNLKFVYKKKGEKVDNSSLDNEIKFNYPEDELPPGVDFDLTKIDSTGNILLDSFIFLTRNAVTVSGNYPLIGEIPANDLNVFEVRPNNDEENAHKTDETDVCNELIFVMNGSTPAYKTIKHSDGKTRIVIPITDFSFNTDSKNIFLQSKIFGNINGVVKASTNGRMDSDSQDAASAEATAVGDNSKENNNSNATIEFDCYNVMSFDRNNPNSAITFSVYTEFGELHPISGTATVKEVSYDISGAVVKAHVVATQSYNNLSVESEKATIIQGQDDDSKKEG